MSARRAGLAVLVLAALVLGYRLEDPPGYVHDECYQAFTAGRWARGDRRAWDHHATREDMAAFAEADTTAYTHYEWIHPPSAKLIISGLTRLVGFRPAAWRLGSVLFGLLALAMTWRLAARVAGERVALTALVLVAADGMVFVLSRVGMNDIHVTACAVTALYAFHRSWSEGRARWLLAGGAALGVGLTMKWSIASLGLGCAALLLGRILWRARRGELRGRALATALAAWAGAFLALPLSIYLLSYVPYFLAGYGWSDLISLHRRILEYHRELRVEHSMGSRWWEWPLVRRPVWFYGKSTGEASRLIYAMGNPLLWWAFLPALAWTAVRFLRRRDPGDGVLLLGFFAFWSPWIFIDRVAFQQYLLPAVPYGAIAVARGLDDLAGRLRAGGRWLAPLYAAAVVAVFASFYPFWSARPIPRADLEGRRYFWFERWRER